MEKRKFFANVVILLIIVIAAFFSYRYFFVSDDSTDSAPGLVGSSEIDRELSQANDEFLIVLERLEKVTLKTKLFDDPAYQALVNFSQELVAEPQRRVNPFAPLGFNPEFEVAAEAENDTEEDGSR